MHIEAQDLYEIYERHHDENGVTVRSWAELGKSEMEAWKSVADFIYYKAFSLEKAKW